MGLLKKTLIATGALIVISAAMANNDGKTTDNTNDINSTPTSYHKSREDRTCDHLKNIAIFNIYIRENMTDIKKYGEKFMDQPDLYMNQLESIRYSEYENDLLDGTAYGVHDISYCVSRVIGKKLGEQNG